VPKQADIFRDSDAARAAAFLAAAETARNDPHYTLEERDRRARYYAEQAALIQAKHPKRRR
jgi:hypothetical protein